MVLFTSTLIYASFRIHRREHQQKNVICTKELQLRELAEAHKGDSMEIDLQHLKLYDILGEGAFGIVRQGILKPFNQLVAVKMLKGFFYRC